ncbi:hypothetical protein BOTCAL_0005g00610 [Botryotinia calthae]|uniref:Uncharacterized protein n=1 Tax=Botryotinia calthae TaxID=38488 RepID=A0A4Y8DJN1_9HELO|nr:hypothetical protein BOTCAL_0005g00610 [Botryotinia calthae]
MDIIEGLTRSDQIYGPLEEENQANLPNIRQFISAVNLTIPSGPSKDLQIHDGTARLHGRITIPILSQNATFSENNRNWTALQAFAPTLEKFICNASISLMKDLKANHPMPQGRARNDYEAALEICQRPLPAGKKAMPFSDGIRSVNCFSHVRISANVSMGNPWEKLAPDTDTRACGPWVVVVPWGAWHIFGNWSHGGRIVIADGIDRELKPGDHLHMRKEEYVYNTPFAPFPGNQRYQFEYFMPHIPEHNGQMFEEMAEIAKGQETECPETVMDSVAFGGKINDPAGPQY